MEGSCLLRDISRIHEGSICIVFVVFRCLIYYIVDFGASLFISMD